MLDYEAAAQEAAASNPDGWAVDPEATLASDESIWEAEHFGRDPLEEARRQWRYHHAKFAAGESVGYHAGMLVHLAKVGADLAAKDPNACQGGKCRDILSQCSRHSAEYQRRWGRAANE